MTEAKPRIEQFIDNVQLICNKPNALKWITILPLVLFSPSLFFGLVSDDYFQYWNIHYNPSINSPLDLALSMFAFIPNGIPGFNELMPWWLNDRFSLSFFRPISVLTHWLDSVLWPHAFFLHHLHSLVWACLCVLVVHKVYNRVIRTGWLAVMCTLLFSVQDSHAFANGWLANRNANVAFVFGMLALDTHIRSRTEQRSLLLPVSLVLLSLLSAEAGLCTMAFIGSWALLYEKNLKSSIKSLVPYAIVVVSWRLVYKAMGYGADGLTMYADPITSPTLFIEKVLNNIPLLLVNQWYKFPVETVFGLPQSLRAVPAVIGFISLIPLAVMFAPVIRKHKVLQFWALSMVIALIPVCAVFPMERLLLFSGVGAIGLLAGLIQHHSGALIKWLLFLHLPIAMLLCPLKTMTVKLQDVFLIGYDSLPSDMSSTSHIFYLNGLEFVPPYTTTLMHINKVKTPEGMHLFSPAPEANITRIDDYTFEMTLASGWFERGAIVTTPPKEFHVGEQNTTPEFSVDVMAVTIDGQPSRLRYTMRDRLDHPDYRWMIWRGLHYEEIDLMFEIGKPKHFENPTSKMFQA
ncbi:MAG: hypothetical protein ACON4U_15255, partial [Myxococcota bacterium]